MNHEEFFIDRLMDSSLSYENLLGNWVASAIVRASAIT